MSNNFYIQERSRLCSNGGSRLRVEAGGPARCIAGAGAPGKKGMLAGRLRSWGACSSVLTLTGLVAGLVVEMLHSGRRRQGFYSSRLMSCCSFALGERSRGRRRPFRRSSVFKSARRRSDKRLSCSTPIFTYHNAISVRFQQPVF